MMRAMSRSHSDAGDAHEMHAQLIATKRELNTAHTELSRGRVEIQRLETLVKKQQQQLDALLGDGDGPTRHELEKNLAVRRVAEKVAALKAVISDREAEVRTRDATIAELRQSQAATTIEEINRANEEYYAEVCRLRRALGARGPVSADGHDSAVREAMQLAATDDTIRMAAASGAVQRRMRIAAENEALRAAGPLPAEAGRVSAVRQAMTLANADETVRQAMSIAAQNEALRSMLDTSAREKNREPRVARAVAPPQQEDSFERRINLPNGGVTDPTKWPPPKLRLASRAPGSTERPTRGGKLRSEGDGASTVATKPRKRRPRSASAARRDDTLEFPEEPPSQPTGSPKGRSRASDLAPRARAPRQGGTRKTHVQKLYDACKLEALWYQNATPPADTPEAEVGEIYRKVRARALGAAGATVSLVDTTATGDEDDDGRVEAGVTGGAEEGKPADGPARGTEEAIATRELEFAILFADHVPESSAQDHARDLVSSVEARGVCTGVHWSKEDAEVTCSAKGTSIAVVTCCLDETAPLIAGELMHTALLDSLCEELVDGPLVSWVENGRPARDMAADDASAPEAHAGATPEETQAADEAARAERRAERAALTAQRAESAAQERMRAERAAHEHRQAEAEKQAAEADTAAEAAVATERLRREAEADDAQRAAEHAREIAMAAAAGKRASSRTMALFAVGFVDRVLEEALVATPRRGALRGARGALVV